MKKRIQLFIILLFFGLCSLNAQDPWILSTEGKGFDNYYGVTVGNGVVGVISAPEPLKVKEVVLSGVYDLYKRGRVNNFLPNYNLINLNLSIDGDNIYSWNVSDFKQELNMKTAEFEGSFKFKDKALVTYSYYALRHLPHCVLLNVEIQALTNIHISADNILETPESLHGQQNYFSEIHKSHVYVPLLTSVAKSPSEHINVAVSNTFLFDEAPHTEPKIFHKMEETDRHSMWFTKEIKKGETYSFGVVGSLLSSVHTSDPYNQAERLTIYAKLEGKERLIEQHKKQWNKLWESDIEIEGDKQAQQDIRSMLYHLYSFSRENNDASSSPMGLSGLGYNGHVFWDTEIFMFPPLLLLQPNIAKSMIEYRFNRLNAARRQAAIYGYQGAMFPWESAASGEEETPVWAFSGPFEHHITADIAIAAWNYYLVTGDKEWLQEKGWPILRETATFWVSRVDKNEQGEYEIKNVVAADEWAENVDNNAYTNAAAIKNLEAAVQCAKLLNQKVPEEWLTVAKNIPIKQMENGVTREHDSYDGQLIKQADVNLLAYPLGIITDKKQIEKDLNYYEKKVPQQETPAMTQAIFSLLYSRLGNSEKAYYWFQDAYNPNILSPFRVIAECKGGTNPYFATGAGGILQAVIMGFGGLDISGTGGVKQIKTTMPPHWKKITIKGVGPDKKEFTNENK